MAQHDASTTGTGRGTRPGVHDKDGLFVASPDEVAKVYTEYFDELTTERVAPEVDKPWLRLSKWAEVRSKLAQMEPIMEVQGKGPSMVTEPTRPGELEARMGEMNANASAGADDLQLSVLRLLLKPGFELHLNAVRRAVDSFFKQGRFPDGIGESTAEFYMLYKGSGDPAIMKNQRGIMILNVLYQIVTGIFGKRLSSMLYAAGAVHDWQAAGRPGSDCTDRVVGFLNALAMDELEGIDIHALITDIASAFPSVPFKVLEEMYVALGLGGRVGEMAKGLRNGFKARVRTGSARGEWFDSERGIMQGSWLGPFEFVLFMNLTHTV